MSVLFVNILMIILIKINSFSLVKSKIYNNQLIRSNKYIHIMMDSSVCFSEDNYNKKIYNLLMDKLYYVYDYDNDNDNDNYDYDSENIFEKPLYTLVWYDCEQCKKLLNDMELLQLKKIYLNTKYEFDEFDEFSDLNNNLQKPLLFKDENYISDDLFDIYEEIYKN